MGGGVTEALTPAQRAALGSLVGAIDPAAYYLAGGVAVALRLHHRGSRDLDLFTLSADPSALAEPFGDPSIVVVSRSQGTLHLTVGGIPASLLRYRYPLLSPPEALAGVPVAVASLDDLECMKLSAIAGRGAARDFWDLHALLEARSRSLGEALDGYRRKYASEDIGHVVRSLVYFAAAAAEPMPAGLTGALWTRIKADLTAWVRSR